MAAFEKRSPSGSLRGALAPGRFRAARPEDAIDGAVPQCVAVVRSHADVAAVVGVARRSKLALVCLGGGTKTALGNPPRAFDVGVSTSALVSVVERNPEDMTVRVEAGIPLSRLARILANDGQRLAVDPAEPTRATAGGLVATNTTGGLAHGFGAPRDLVLGMTVVDGRGRVLRVGGRVVKNVAGYDLVRLFTGSFGTLAIITEIVFRTHPLPETASTFRFAFESAEALEGARRAVLASPLPLAAFDFERIGDGSAQRWFLVVRVEGTRAEVDAQRAMLVSLCNREPADERLAWESPVHAKQDECADDAVVVRAGVLPADAVALAGALAASLRADVLRIAGRAGDGLVRVFARTESADAALDLARSVRLRAEAAGGRAVVERISASVKPRIDVWGEPPSSVRLMHAIKTTFDPDGVLAPGRFVGGI